MPVVTIHSDFVCLILIYNLFPPSNDFLKEIMNHKLFYKIIKVSFKLQSLIKIKKNKKKKRKKVKLQSLKCFLSNHLLFYFVSEV